MKFPKFVGGAVCCIGGIIIGLLISFFLPNSCPRGYRLSGTAIGEIHFNPKCSGQEKDWFVTKEYVYANCPGGPLTVQNYEFK